MRVSIDGRHVNGSGIGTYVANLLKEYKHNDTELNAYCKEDQWEYFKNMQINTTVINSNIYGIKEQMQMLKVVNRKHHDILHWPHYNIPLLYNGPFVTTIHDIIHLKFPQWLPNKAAYYYAYFMIGQALKKSNKIITVSEYSKADLLNIYKVPEEKIRVIYNGVSDEFTTQIDLSTINDMKEIYKINKPYILYIGNVRAHKNILGIIKAFQRFKATCKGYKLVIAGEKHENLGFQEFDEDIQMLGFVENKKLPALYAGASLFVFPSLYEGFGLPPLEAMACGTPVITSNASSLPEVVGDAAITVNPYNIDEIVKAIYDVLSNQDLSNKLINKGIERAKLFTWEKSARKTLAVYDEVLSEVK